MLHLEIVTPEQVAYTDDVDLVSVPSVEGRLGILPKHVPLFAQLTEGELKIKKGNEEFFLSIGGGFVEVTREKVIILVTRAVNAEALNEVEILKAKQSAEEALNHPVSRDAAQAAEVMLRQTIVDLKILQRRKKNLH